MPSIFDRIYISLNGKPNTIQVGLGYGFLLMSLYLIYQQVNLQLQFPEFTSSHLNGFVVVGMLFLNNLAFNLPWPSPRARFVLRAVAIVWLVFGDISSSVITPPIQN